MGNRPTPVSRWSASVSQRGGNRLGLHAEPASYCGGGGGGASSWLRIDLPGGVASSVSVPSGNPGVNQGQGGGGSLGEDHMVGGGQRGSEPARDTAPSARDDSTAKHLSPGRKHPRQQTPTSPLGVLITVWTDFPYLPGSFHPIHNLHFRL